MLQALEKVSQPLFLACLSLVYVLWNEAASYCAL